MPNSSSRYPVHSPRLVQRIQKSFAVMFAALADKLAMAEQ
jgi:hypothetical protein